MVFGPEPRHYTFKVNRKERRAALRSALSIHAERGSIAVFDADGVRRRLATKAAAKLRQRLGRQGLAGADRAGRRRGAGGA